jgi:diguanylate cyclase (GGDEF)-like protein/PAS domain S-box-containing protein
MDYRLQDLVDVSALQRMLDGLAGIAEAAFAVTGPQGEAIVQAGPGEGGKKRDAAPESRCAPVVVAGMHLADVVFGKPGDEEHAERYMELARGIAGLIGSGGLARLRELNAQASLKDSRALADNSTDVIARTDERGAFLYVSPSVERVAGYRPEELMGRPLAEFTHPDDLEQVRRLNLWLLLHKEPLSVSYRYRRKDGSYIWLETSARPVFGADGKLAEVQSSSRDVTRRRIAEEELKRTKERLHVLLKNIDAAIFQLDGDGAFTLAEGRGLQKLNRSHRPVTGRSIVDVHDGDEAVARAVKQALSGKRATAEYATDGVILEESFAPYFDADGRQAGVIGLAVDVTQRKLAEQRLNAEKERLRVTLQSIGDGVIATDREGNVSLMNGVAEELTGWGAQAAAGKPFAQIFDIFDETTGEACPDPVERVLSTGNAAGLGSHTALRSASGAVRSIDDSAAPILDGARNVLGAILVFRDVTDSKKKESEITFLSYHDVLTGLYNRAFFEEETHRLDTVRQLPISVIMGDVNGLKLTNDVFGHAEGDNLLVRIADILRECCRDEDIIARVGGDEFCILLPMTSYAAASDICRRIYTRCDKVEYGLPSGSAKLSISLGFATKTEQSESIHGITKAAEDSMYRRKLLESRSQHSFLISSIRTTLFEKSFETEQHAQRLIANSKAIAAALNLPEDQLNDIELFALLHDIGKIAIDSRILTKPEPLDETEWAEMKRHPEIGFRIAQSSPDLAHIAEYILCHHERWDGSGYPQGLKGTAIPLLARILLVVDAYDAMTQDRVYRKALTKEEACAELMKNAGTQFDPNIVWVFIEMLEHESYIA